ncbi:MAG TPA: hypothetical protein EYP14_00395 [Planctomycetaceae bacterium]|nr:hypothetical protein [Planctomycetaceae bacterium]
MTSRAGSVQLVTHRCCPELPAPVVAVPTPAALVPPPAVVVAPTVPVVPVYPAPVWLSPAPVVTWAAPAVPPAVAPVPVLAVPSPRTPDVRPLPGTLGLTYRQPSRPVPWDKHPRTGMVEVTILDETRERLAKEYPDAELKVTVSDIRNFFKPLDGYLGKDGLWHFESDPLYPGIPHIYDVKFEMIRKVHKVEIKYGHRVEYDEEHKVDDLGFRRIRLIPGRIVEVSF